MMSPLAWILHQYTRTQRDEWVSNAFALGLKPSDLLTPEEMQTLEIHSSPDPPAALTPEEELWAALDQIHDPPVPSERPLPYSRAALSQKAA